MKNWVEEHKKMIGSTIILAGVAIAASIILL